MFITRGAIALAVAWFPGYQGRVTLSSGADFDEDCWDSGFVMSERKEVPREEDMADGVDGEVRGTSDDNFGDVVGYESVENVRREDSIASRAKSEARQRYLSSKLKGFV
ncbi:hypothetical protein NDU88_005690 [Pleurodeles waltl]|uniref:Uncharacterized protein n=1 Tax=Pleurodeles waltl TaxID=8319 RepID=A0AAV7SMD4_PLEWA|nr:hypothetical protein NDU88_005690 [Pleurodeles waltl]